MPRDSDASDSHSTRQRWGPTTTGEPATAGTAEPLAVATGTTAWQSGRRGRNQPNTTMAMLTHVLAPFTWLIGPLVVYMSTRRLVRAKSSCSSGSPFRCL